MSRSRTRALRSEINVVPYVDVMLVLLVIFMITAPMLSQGIDVNLPNFAAEPLGAPSEEPVILSVDAAGRFYLSFGGDPLSPLDEQALIDRATPLLSRNPGVKIFVRGDEQATHGRVTRALDLLRRAGANSVAIVTDLPSSEQR